MQTTEYSSSLHQFSKFFLDNKESFLAFAYSYTRDKEEAEDILMESMIALLENKERWAKDSNWHGLLLTIIKNKALNFLAREQTRLRAEEEINNHKQRELNLRISTLEACDPDLIFDKEIQHIVQRTLNQMSEQSRRIFLLSRYRNLPNKVIAEQLGLSVKSVEFHITKSLKLLRKELKDYLISLLL